MKRQYNSKTGYILILLIFLFSLNSCSDDTNTIVAPPSGPENNTISGTITFADTNFITSGGYYDIGIFPNPSQPPAYWFGPPSANDTLNYVKVGNTYQATYTLKGVSNGSYVVAVGFRKDVGGQSPIMGVYGCDTAHTQCFLDPIRATITDDIGLENINFLSWADTTNKVF